jgi:hypothetical protein
VSISTKKQFLKVLSPRVCTIWNKSLGVFLDRDLNLHQRIQRTGTIMYVGMHTPCAFTPSIPPLPCSTVCRPYVYTNVGGVTVSNQSRLWWSSRCVSYSS